LVFDHISRIEQYAGLARPLRAALDWLARTDVATIECGRHDLDGERVFALVQEYTTRALDECRWEAHRRYCDVQFLARGVERIGFAPRERMSVVEAYDAERDVEFLAGTGDFATLRAGGFMILWPHDAHMPCVVLAEPQPVRKIVVKAQLDG
jgi:biofilm protein TabA